MTIELTILISALSMSAAMIFGFLNQKRNFKQDTVNDAQQFSAMMLKLELIGSQLGEIKNEMASQKDEVKELREKLIVLEQRMLSFESHVS